MNQNARWNSEIYLSPYSDDKHYNMFFHMEFGDQEVHSD